VTGSAQNPLTLNRFLYAAANPATLVDPDGHNFVNMCRDPDECMMQGMRDGKAITPTKKKGANAGETPPAPPTGCGGHDVDITKCQPHTPGWSPASGESPDPSQITYAGIVAPAVVKAAIDKLTASGRPFTAQDIVDEIASEYPGDTVVRIDANGESYYGISGEYAGVPGANLVTNLHGEAWAGVQVPESQGGYDYAEIWVSNETLCPSCAPVNNGHGVEQILTANNIRTAKVTTEGGSAIIDRVTGTIKVLEGEPWKGAPKPGETIEMRPQYRVTDTEPLGRGYDGGFDPAAAGDAGIPEGAGWPIGGGGGHPELER
jgi:hypothetical protein